MFSEQSLAENSLRESPAGHELPSQTEARRAPEPHIILVAADSVLQQRGVLEYAEKLRGALGFELCVLPVVPRPEAVYTHLLGEAERGEVALLVVHNPPPGASGVRDPRWHAFLRSCPRPVLAVGTEGKKLVVAASDCADPALPVVQEARIVAAALNHKLVLVHNVDPLATQFAERVGLPMSTPLAEMLAQRLREQLESAAVDSEVVITRDADNARAILDVANAHHADLIVVGVKPAEGAPHGTADAIIDAAQQSVLFLPLPTHSKPPLLG